MRIALNVQLIEEMVRIFLDLFTCTVSVQTPGYKRPSNVGMRVYMHVLLLKYSFCLEHFG